MNRFIFVMMLTLMLAMTHFQAAADEPIALYATPQRALSTSYVGDVVGFIDSKTHCTFTGVVQGAGEEEDSAQPARYFVHFYKQRCGGMYTPIAKRTAILLRGAEGDQPLALYDVTLTKN